MRPAVLPLFLFFIAPSPEAFAWGPAAHENVQENAVRLLIEQNHPLAQVFGINEETLKHLASVPNSPEWKAKNKQEQDLHYFEVDAFTRTGADELAIAALPADDYDKIRGRYLELLHDNVAYVLEFDRNQSDPAAYGTAPWRVLQLYDLSVSALRDQNVKLFVFYSGLLGHYLADVTEPLNTTLNFDGRHYPIPATGVYAAFEEVVSAQAAAESASYDDARSALAGRGVDGLVRYRILGEIFRVINEGYPYVEPMLKAFAEQCGKAHTGGRVLASVARSDNKPQQTSKNPRSKKAPIAAARPPVTLYCDPPLDPVGTNEALVGFSKTELVAGLNVKKLAAKRLGAASALLARIWASAYNAAGRPTLSPLAIPFKEYHAESSWVEPTYLLLNPARAPGSSR